MKYAFTSSIIILKLKHVAHLKLWKPHKYLIVLLFTFWIHGYTNVQGVKMCFSHLIVPVGDGNGLLKFTSGSGILILRGGSGSLDLAGEGWRTVTGGSASSTNDWNTNLMLVLGKRNVHLAIKLSTYRKVILI